MSHYKLDVCGKITADQLAEEKVRHELKKQQENVFHTDSVQPNTKEKTLIGYIILYVPPVSVQSHPKVSFHKTQVTVISVDPDALSGIKLTLDNTDRLEDSHYVMRIQIYKKGKLVSYPGCLRPISSFILDKQDTFSDQSMNLIVENSDQIITRSVEKSTNNSTPQVRQLMGCFLTGSTHRVSNRYNRTSHGRQLKRRRRST